MPCPSPYGLNEPRRPRQSDSIIKLAGQTQDCLEHLEDLVATLRQTPDGNVVLDAIRETMLRLAEESRG